MEFVLSELSVQERYKFLSAVVIPRPIALTTTRDEAGVHNAAPFSFFNLFSEDPAIVVLGFSSRSEDPTRDTRKDTLRNIERAGAFVVNMVDEPITEAMNVCATEFPYGVSEIETAGLSLVPSRFIDVMRIKESPVNLECRLYQKIELSFRRTLILGEVVHLHIADHIWDAKTRRIIPEQYNPVARLYGTNYAWLGKRFEMAIAPFDAVKKPAIQTRSRANATEHEMQPAKAFTIKAHGAAMPVVGYGTMEFPEPDKAAGLVTHAIRCGYRHIDTARKYGSEQWVGQGIRASGIDRKELFVTTKVTEDNAKAADFARSVDESLKATGLDYVDLLLIHWPQPRVPLAETLGALAKAKRDGLARNIGVSNFTVALLDEAVRVCPEPLVTNQIEYHAYIRQDKLIAACRKHGVLVSCHVPLARGMLLTDPVISAIAAVHKKSPAQVALRWLIQQPDVAVVPRALQNREIEENIDIFDFTLTADEMTRISALRDRNLRVVDPEVRRPNWDVG